MSAEQEFQLRAYRYALDPTDSQCEVLARHVGAARRMFNHALGRKVDAHRRCRSADGQRTG